MKLVLLLLGCSVFAFCEELTTEEKLAIRDSQVALARLQIATITAQAAFNEKKTAVERAHPGYLLTENETGLRLDKKPNAELPELDPPKGK